LEGQNLVKNSSFEDYRECPSRFNQLDYCKDWFSTGNGSSPEYFNGCNTYNQYIGYSVGTPENLAGNQEPNTGNAYAGIILFASDDDFHYREYIQGTLIDSLKNGHNYNFSFHISLAESSVNFTDRISVCFSNKQKLASKIPYSTLECKNTVTIKAIDFCNSTGWTEAKGSYLASGRERFITIGLFADDLTKKEFDKLRKENKLKDGKKHCYYYIDDVSVIAADQQGEFSHQEKGEQ
jgi:OmpA-OmpF porin, OOP family